MEKFKNKYRIPSHRKPNWDYSADALYFLTIVTQNRICNLGAIVNNEMILSDFGAIVEEEWFKSFDIRNELLLHDFILMPNHLHTVVEIYNDNRGNGAGGDGAGNDETGGDGTGGDGTGGNGAVETHGRVSTNRTNRTNRPTLPLTIYKFSNSKDYRFFGWRFVYYKFDLLKGF